jgi:hypothetical protein
VIRVYVGIDDVMNRHTQFSSPSEVVLWRFHWIHDDTRARSAASDDVRCGDDGIGVQELTENHALISTGSPAAFQSGSPSFARLAR